MSDEAAFLAGIRTEPKDDLRRLVYADWLDERGDEESRAKAEYLRLEVHMSGLDDDHPDRDGHILRMRQVSRFLSSYWKALVSKLPIERCAVRWEFLCPKKWDELAETPDAQVRFCSACKKEVHYCTSIDEAREQVRQHGHCVVIDLKVRRRVDDLPPPALPRIDGEEEEEEANDDSFMGLIDFGSDHEPPHESWLRRAWRKLTGQ
jgi:uncharacterized protein (TIGR02996 family)